MASIALAYSCASLLLPMMVTLSLCMHQVDAIYQEIEYEFFEEQPIGTVLGNIQADIAKYHRQASNHNIHNTTHHLVRYGQQSDNAYFRVAELTGDVICIQVVDRELLCPTYATISGCDRQMIDVVIKTQHSAHKTAFSAVNGFHQQQIVKLVITIVDINDHGPVFPQDWHMLELVETASVGDTFGVPEAEDADSEPLSVQSYALEPFDEIEHDNANEIFELVANRQVDGSHEVKIRLKRPIDLETRNFYSLVLVAIDGGSPPRSGSVQLNIHIRDANDNSPTWDSTIYETSVDENVPFGTSIARVHAIDPDTGQNGVVRYSLSSPNADAHRHSGSSWNHDGEGREPGVAGRLIAEHVFAINESTGEVFVVGLLDFEARRVHELTVVATDRGPDAIPAFAKLTVNVNDVNDNRPRIVINAVSHSRHHDDKPQHVRRHNETTNLDGIVVNEEYAVVAENSPRGTFVCHVAITDPDTAMNSLVECSVIDNGKESILFLLEPLIYDQSSSSLASSSSTEYKLVTAAMLDRELVSTHRVTIHCHDYGQPPLAASKSLEIRVEDDNDNTPFLPVETFFVAIVENNQLGAFVTTINATDLDEGRNALLEYRLEPLNSLSSAVSGPSRQRSGLTIDEETGTITADVRFDYETRQSYTYLLTVIDQGEAVQRSAVATLVLDVVDTNDELPRFERSSYSFHVAENRTAPLAVGKVRATDADRSSEHNRIFYFLDDQHRTVGNVFGVDPLTGELFTRSALDREATAIWRFRVRATNDPTLGPKSGFAITDVHIHVDDVNDNPPIIKEPVAFNHTYHVLGASTRSGQVIARVRAIDLDDGANARLSYALLLPTGTGNDSSSIARMFSVDVASGDVKTARRVDGRLDAGQYALTIVVRDAGTPRRLSSAAHLLINVNGTAAVMDDFDGRSPFSVNVERNNVVGEISTFDYDAMSSIIDGDLASVTIGVIAGLGLLLAIAITCSILRTRRYLHRNQHHQHHSDQNNANASHQASKKCDIKQQITGGHDLMTSPNSNGSTDVAKPSSGMNVPSSIGRENKVSNGFPEVSSRRAAMFCVQRQSSLNGNQLGTSGWSSATLNARSTGSGSHHYYQQQQQQQQLQYSTLSYGRHWYHADTSTPVGASGGSPASSGLSAVVGPAPLSPTLGSQQCRVYPRPDAAAAVAGQHLPRPMFGGSVSTVAGSCHRTYQGQ